MEDVICASCGAGSIEKAIYCFQCGHQLKCKSCLELLVAGSKHCISCGVAVAEIHTAGMAKSLNTIKFKENKDERFYEIEFTNDVGKEIKEVVADLLKNKLGSGTDLPITFRENINHHPQTFGYPENENESQMVGLSSIASPEIVHKENPEEFPHLNDLEIKLDCRENEWLLLYAFYSSGYGTTTFNKEVVWQKYKDKRLTETRFKNLGTNWKSLFKKYISTVKDNEFRFTSQGLVKARELLSAAKNGHKTLGRAPRKVIAFAHSSNNGHKSLPLSRKILANSIVADEFDVHKNDYKISLEDFFSRKKPGSGNPNRIVTIAYYITKINHQEYFTEGNIDYAYRILNLTGKPVHLKQVIINLKNDRVWFQKVMDGDTTGWRITRQAEIYVEEKLPSVP